MDREKAECLSLQLKFIDTKANPEPAQFNIVNIVLLDTFKHD